MKTAKIFNLLTVAFLVLIVSSCSVIGGIFKTGMGVGIFIAVTIIVLIVVLIARAKKGSS
jgi:hypothetical protein